jgi:hypothetical protein
LSNKEFTSRVPSVVFTPRFDYDEHAHSTPNSDDETAAQEIYAGPVCASSVLDTSIVAGISTSLQGCEEEEKEAGAGQ